MGRIIFVCTLKVLNNEHVFIQLALKVLSDCQATHHSRTKVALRSA